MSLSLELHSKELLLYPILQTVSEGIILADASLNMIFYNESAEKILATQLDKFLGKNIDQIRPEFTIDSMLKNHQGLTQTRAFINDEEINLTKGLIKVAPDNFYCYLILSSVNTFNDIQLQSLINNPYEGIAVFNHNSRLIYANELCYNFFGCENSEQLSDELASLIPLTLLSESINKARPMAETITIKSRTIELIYLPIIRHNNLAGIIVKSSLTSRQERNWGHLVEEYNSGTATYYLDHIVGNSEAINKQKEFAKKAARTTSTVLITGESGTGKELFAHAIHNMSPRRKGPFIKVNCAAVPETLLESELFGYAEGAFTGARKDGKPGKFELANHGTIFLDEVADMTLSMQAKLLRVLQEKEVERVGAIHTTKVNVRIIAATNKDLSQLVAENKFREDLYYRLNVIILNLPSLKERKDDIPIIATSILKRLNKQLGTGIHYISDDVMKCFCEYHWPGNIRELENILERAVNFTDGNTITLEQIPEHIKSVKTPLRLINTSSNLEKLLEEREKEIIIDTLNSCNGNKSKAAEMLNIHRSVLYRKLTKYNLN